MKQHITPKQAKQVTEEQFYSMFDQVVKREDWADYHHKKITIGKMLEYLSAQWIIVQLSLDRECCSRVGMVIDNSLLFRDFGEKELCDALWEAVKDSLTKK